MGLDSLVSVSVTKSTQTPTRENFGTPLIAAYHTRFPERVRTYTSLSAMVADGFYTSEAAYLAASAIQAQNPRPASWKIGRRALAPVHTIQLKCLSATEGDVYKFKIGLAGGTLTEISYTVLASATTTTVATAIELLVEAVTGLTSSSSTDTITVTVTSPSATSYLIDVEGWKPAQLEVKDTTSDPGIATDLAAILVADSDWFGLGLDSNSKAEVLAAAAWCESNRKLLISNTSDTECGDNAVTTDVMSSLKTSAYAFTSSFFSGKKLLSYLGLGLMALGLTYTPGEITFAYKTVAGAPADDQTSLPAAKETVILSKNGNTYSVIAGLNTTFPGKTGAGEFIDVTHFVEWLRSEIKTRLFARLKGAKKVPFTDRGADAVRATVQGALDTGVANGGFDPGNGSDIAAPTAFVPRVADVSTIDRAARNLPGVTFSGRLAGAIHTLDVDGEVTV
jgi:hypothetical protein